IVLALQTITSRTIDPIDSVVVSVTKFNGGDAYNVIPEHVDLAGTVRALKGETMKATEERMRSICAGLAQAGDVTAAFDFKANYPVTENDPGEAVFAGDIAAAISGESAVDRAVAPLMAGEDFSYMLNAR